MATIPEAYPATPSEDFALALHELQANRRPQAEQLLRKVLATDPDHLDALQKLAMLAYQSRGFNEAAGLLLRAIAVNGSLPSLHCNLAAACLELGRTPEAAVCCRRAIELKPDYAFAWFNLGNAQRNQGLIDDAITSYRRAVELRPDFADALHRLGCALQDAGRLDESIAVLHGALAIAPDHFEARYRLANVFAAREMLDEAADAYRQVLALVPHAAQAWNNLGYVLKSQGLIEDAVACMRRALDVQPDYYPALNNLLFTLPYVPGAEPAAILEEHRRAVRPFFESLGSAPLAHPNDRSPERRLRIGYVSPYFQSHCQSFFIAPLLANHDRERVQIFCYSDTIRPDRVTERLRATADVWRDTARLDHVQLATLIRDDGIDVLVDLTMHMAGNRLVTFARRPAPVQLSWLAYPGTTGVPAIGYRLTDPHLDPPGLSDGWYSEESVRLPDTFWCYDPLDDAPAVNPLPSGDSEPVTFGCLNNFCKVTDGTLKLWARVLNAVESRLLLLCPDGSPRRRTLDRLAAEGIAADRVAFTSFLPRSEYLRAYHRIDIGLDTLPANGHTTSLDSYWMGVPVVTRVGATVLGRAGLCHLMNLGLPELIAESDDRFVEIAVGLAWDRPRLKELRSTLRPRMQASPLMDAPRFARNIETAYREMWRRWCNS